MCFPFQANITTQGYKHYAGTNALEKKVFRRSNI